MMFKTHTCYTIHCDGCEAVYEHDYIPHFDHPAESFDELRDHDWAVTRDHKVYCRNCTSKTPDCVCPDGESCDDDCVPGCPCLLHQQIEPTGPCAHCGEVFERAAALRLHVFTKHVRGEEASRG